MAKNTSYKKRFVVKDIVANKFLTRDQRVKQAVEYMFADAEPTLFKSKNHAKIALKWFLFQMEEPFGTYQFIKVQVARKRE